MQTSDISKLLLYSKSIEDEQADEWLQLKVDTNKADNPSKLICEKKKNFFFSVNVGDYLSQKNHCYVIYDESVMLILKMKDECLLN